MKQCDESIGANFLKRHFAVIVVIVIAISFALRIYGAFRVPLTYDENTRFQIVSELTFDVNNLVLLMGHEETHNPPLALFISKVGFLLFGENKFGLRFLFVVFGTITIVFLFFLIKKAAGDMAALIVLMLTGFSQFFIGFSRLANEDGLLLFFISGMLLSAYQAITSGKMRHVFQLAGCIGMGLLVKLSVVTILPVTIYFVFFSPQNKKRCDKKLLVPFFAIIAIFLFPTVLWNVLNGLIDVTHHVARTDFPAISLVPVALFFGEIIVYFLQGFDPQYVYSITSVEYPFINWIMGILCLLSVIFWSKNKRHIFIDFLFWLFLFNFVFFCFFRPRTGGGYYFHLDNFWWAITAVIPAFILVSLMVKELIEKNRVFLWATLLLLMYFMGNAIFFVRCPINCFIPNQIIKEKILKSGEDPFFWAIQSQI